MADFDGFLSGVSAVADNPQRSGDSSIADAVYDSFDSDFLVGDLTGVIPVPPETYHQGILQTDTTPTAQLLDRIYFFPVDPQTFLSVMQFGIITAEESQEFSIWNAYISQGKVLTWSAVDPEGSSIDTPNPEFFNGMESKTYNATVLAVGPTIQDTDYNFVISGFAFLLNVLGERLQELDSVFNPNWAEPPKLKFKFQTTIWRNNAFFEQRRPIFENMIREIQASFLVEKEEFEQAHNILKRSHDKFFFVPIFTEILHPTNATLQGETVLTFQESIADYYQLRNMTTLLLVQSIHDNTLNEYLAIDSIDTGANEITLESPIANEFITPETIIMPTFVGIIKEFKPKYLTGGKVASFNLTFSELRKGS